MEEIITNKGYTYSMEAINILWVITFFFFTLILIFIWSKIIVVSKKLNSVSLLVAECEKIESGEAEAETVENENGSENS